MNKKQLIVAWVNNTVKGRYEMRKLIAISLLITMPFLQGCAIGILAAGVGYGVGQGRKASAKMLEAKAKYTEQYQNYRIELEKINLEREKSGLKPVNIPTFEEWLETQPLSSSEIKLFQKYGIISAKELKAKQQEEAKKNTDTPQEKTEPKTNFNK